MKLGTVTRLLQAIKRMSNFYRLSQLEFLVKKQYRHFMDTALTSHEHINNTSTTFIGTSLTFIDTSPICWRHFKNISPTFHLYFIDISLMFYQNLTHLYNIHLIFLRHFNDILRYSNVILSTCNRQLNFISTTSNFSMTI